MLPTDAVLDSRGKKPASEGDFSKSGRNRTVGFSFTRVSAHPCQFAAPTTESLGQSKRHVFGPAVTAKPLIAVANADDRDAFLVCLREGFAGT